MSRDLKKLLDPDDFDLINAQGSTPWIPKEPRELILPYIEKESSQEEEGIEEQRRKAKEVMDKYSVIIEECKTLESRIEKRCKDVKVSVSPKEHLPVIEAMGRVFGQGLQSEISFEHYKVCVQALADLNNQLPKPGDKT